MKTIGSFVPRWRMRKSLKIEIAPVVTVTGNILQIAELNVARLIYLTYLYSLDWETRFVQFIRISFVRILFRFPSCL